MVCTATLNAHPTLNTRTHDRLLSSREDTAARHGRARNAMCGALRPSPDCDTRIGKASSRRAGVCRFEACSPAWFGCCTRSLVCGGGTAWFTLSGGAGGCAVWRGRSSGERRAVSALWARRPTWNPTWTCLRCMLSCGCACGMHF